MRDEQLGVFADGVEDLAGLIQDDLRGSFESKDGECVREPDILEVFNLSPEAPKR